MHRPTTPAQYVLILLDLAEQAGCPRAELLAGTSLADTELSGIGARVADSDFARLALNALALTGEPALGLQLGQRLNLSAHAVLGQAFMTCRDLGEALDLFFRYHHLLSPHLQLQIEESSLQCHLAAESMPWGLPQLFTYEVLFSAMLNTIRGLLNQQHIELQLELPYPAPHHRDAYLEMFGEHVRFNCAAPRITFNAALLQQRLPTSNPGLRGLYESECARLLADLEGEASVAEQTLRLLRKLEGQYPQMPQLAQMLNLSPRTYRRRLLEEEQSFQALLDKVRAEHATRYLRNTDLPLATIAYMLGFNDPSNFRRAYSKWTGRSPREARRGR